MVVFHICWWWVAKLETIISVAKLNYCKWWSWQYLNWRSWRKLNLPKQLETSTLKRQNVHCSPTISLWIGMKIAENCDSKLKPISRLKLIKMYWKKIVLTSSMGPFDSKSDNLSLNFCSKLKLNIRATKESVLFLRKAVILLMIPRPVIK